MLVDLNPERRKPAKTGILSITIFSPVLNGVFKVSNAMI